MSISGLVVALVALVAAVMSPYAVDALEPERKAVDEVAVDVAVKIKDRLAAKARGEEYAPPADAAPTGTDWSRIYPMSVIGAGVLAACVGVVGFVRHDDPRVASATIGVGLCAVVFQYALILAAALLLVLLVGAILAALGGGA